MSVMTDERNRTKKRKARTGADKVDSKAKKIRTTTDDSTDLDQEIELLEQQILSSHKNYNKINDLLEYAKDVVSASTRRKAWLALCAVFSHLLAVGKVPVDITSIPPENVVGRWLLKRYEQFCDLLLLQLSSESQLASKLLVQLVKQEVSIASTNQIWSNGLYPRIIKTLLSNNDANYTFEEFASEHILTYKDTRMYACKTISELPDKSPAAIDQSISFLSGLASVQKKPVHDEENEAIPDSCLATIQPRSKRKPPSDAAYKKTLEQAWLSILRSTLTTSQRKRLLDLVPGTIAPWFSKPEMLTDFLVDSFDAGGSLSLTALSGMFYLIQHRNLDYPAFYTKVYSLIDPFILHSKQRARFLRLMIIFLSSTHLPAALVASFMKRLSRLCLYAPPAGIIAIAPWLYNMVKEHPVCAFMLHRTNVKGTHASKPTTIINQSGEDPFLPYERDPLLTNALESSLWEIHTLATHYHPNVATIASVLGKQFAKQSYKMDDFLEHSYAGMLEAELARNLRKNKLPVVEWRIPKRIFSRPAVDGPAEQDGQDGEMQTETETETLMQRIWDFSV